MREVRELLPARLAPQILSIEDDVVGSHVITFNGGCPGIVLRSTRDDKGEVPC
jgi:hypothetical protein